ATKMVAHLARPLLTMLAVSFKIHTLRSCHRISSRGCLFNDVRSRVAYTPARCSVRCLQTAAGGDLPPPSLSADRLLHSLFGAHVCAGVAFGAPLFRCRLLSRGHSGLDVRGVSLAPLRLARAI